MTMTIESSPECETANQVFPEENGFDAKNMKYPWHYDNRVTNVIDGTLIPKTRDEAKELVTMRFGCAYTYLPETFRNDPEIRRIAIEKSSGYVLKRRRVINVPIAKRILPDLFAPTPGNEFYAKK